MLRLLSEFLQVQAKTNSLEKPTVRLWSPCLRSALLSLFRNLLSFMQTSFSRDKTNVGWLAYWQFGVINTWIYSTCRNTCMCCLDILHIHWEISPPKRFWGAIHRCKSVETVRFLAGPNNHLNRFTWYCSLSNLVDPRWCWACFFKTQVSWNIWQWWLKMSVEILSSGIHWIILLNQHVAI